MSPALRLKLVSERAGNHVHTRVFAGPDGGTLALLGTLACNVGEWQSIGAALLQASLNQHVAEVLGVPAALLQRRNPDPFYATGSLPPCADCGGTGGRKRYEGDRCARCHDHALAAARRAGVAVEE